jgi:hypothetical protein
MSYNIFMSIDSLPSIVCVDKSGNFTQFSGKPMSADRISTVKGEAYLRFMRDLEREHPSGVEISGSPVNPEPEDYHD